jgi:hypothetical protein
MNKETERIIRREIASILNGHLDKSTLTINSDDLPDLLDDIMGEVSKLDFISKEQFEEYRDNWNKKLQEQEEFYRNLINERDTEIEASRRKITELKESITNDSTKRVLETKLAIANSHKRLLKKFVRDILEEM